MEAVVYCSVVVTVCHNITNNNTGTRATGRCNGEERGGIDENIPENLYREKEREGNRLCRPRRGEIFKQSKNKILSFPRINEIYWMDQSEARPFANYWNTSDADFFSLKNLEFIM